MFQDILAMGSGGGSDSYYHTYMIKVTSNTNIYDLYDLGDNSLIKSFPHNPTGTVYETDAFTLTNNASGHQIIATAKPGHEGQEMLLGGAKVSTALTTTPTTISYYNKTPFVFGFK